jgi:hypothetical protein
MDSCKQWLSFTLLLPLQNMARFYFAIASPKYLKASSLADEDSRVFNNSFGMAILVPMESLK